MCRTQQESVQQKVDADLNVAREIMNQAGPVTFAEETVPWQAVNQFTNQSSTVRLPKMMVGQVWLGQNTSLSAPSPIVDKVQNLVGGTCTLFQRMNDAGDMLRVCTNVQTLDNTRAIGTYIPATQSDGSQNPVISSVLRGETFRGRAYVVNAWYITAYEPIVDETGKVVGVLYVGVKQENVKSLREGIMDIVVGKTGYVFVLGGSGNQKGDYIISQNGQRDGENIWEAKDSDGNYFIQEIIQKATSQETSRSGEIPVDFVHYPWKNPGEDQARMKISAITYFEPWDWVIGAGSYEDDFQETQVEMDRTITMVEKAISNMVLVTIALALGLSLISLLIASVLGNRISSPLITTSDILGRVSEGDLTQHLNFTQKDEIGHIAQALNHMVDSVKQVIAGIQDSAEQVASSSEELSSSAQSLSSGATEQAANLEETSASIEELSASINQNSENAENALKVTNNAGPLMQQGTEKVERTVDAMKKIAEQIRIVDDIADQTNLLALNAAIEAARAGEMGKGFAVVAVEVRKLAERSQQAAKEITQLAAESVQLAEQAGEAIGKVGPMAQKTAEMVQEIASACREQASGAEQITEAMSQLDQVTQQNSASSEEAAAASEELAAQAQNMRELVERFKIDKEGHGSRKSTVSYPAAAGKQKLLASRPSSTHRPPEEEQEEYTQESTF
jgi:methyl-accepting chemotaxis protein